MADNKTLPAQGTGSTTPIVRTKDRAGVDTQIVALDLNPAGAETLMGGSMPATVADGADIALGATGDADTANTVIGRLKKLVSLLAGGLPAALSAGGGVKVGVVDALPAGTNAIGKLAANSGVDIGDVDVLSIAAGTNLIGGVNVRPGTTGGLTISRLLSAATTNATSVKGAAGQVFGWYLFNANAATRYLKLYNKASAPTVGTDTPVMTIPIPGGSAANVEFANGIAFGTGIAFALTTGVADSDTGAVAANEIVVNLLYA